MNLISFNAQVIMNLRKAGIRDLEILKKIEDTLSSKVTKNFFDYKLNSNSLSDDIVNIAKLISLTYPKIRNKVNVLVIGAVNGWFAIILSKIYRRVYCVCLEKDLSKELRSKIKKYNLENIFIKHGSFAEGWPGVAPFDDIFSKVLYPKLPSLLIEQICNKGYLIFPYHNNIINKNEIFIYNKELSIVDSNINFNEIIYNNLI